MEKSCCFSGHRPQKLPWKYNEQDPLCEACKNMLSDQIHLRIYLGYLTFYVGMAEGMDLIFAEIILQIKKNNPNIQLICVIPFYGQADKYQEENKLRYEQILQKADRIKAIGEVYSRSCYRWRNEYMVNHSAALIAVYTGRKGGTATTIAYAKQKHLEIDELIIGRTTGLSRRKEK